MKISRFTIAFGIIILFIVLLVFFFTTRTAFGPAEEKTTFWDFQSIDTMKYSRDLSREKLKDPTFDTVIDRQIRQIAETGATHVGIATPYDDEFLPILKRWVAAARKYNLKVWFRGNWSGWEEWFEYPEISRAEHIQKTQRFIEDNSNLFEDGDVFSACPECENGGPGDPRFNGDVEGHRQFLIDEYRMTQAAFKTIGKNVRSNFNSMNGDVAKLVMDRDTTQALGGIVVIDHYVETPEELVQDIREYSQLSGGHVILGEFGAPIPDIHGYMTEEAQAQWINEALQLLLEEPALVGINYWTAIDGSTALWKNNGTPRKAVEAITKTYSPTFVTVTVTNELEEPINAITTYRHKIIQANKGILSLPYVSGNLTIDIMAKGYEPQTATITGQDKKIVLKKHNENLWYQVRKFIKNLF